MQYAMRTRADRNLSALGRALGNKRNRTAFTLIEVLVVVAIIALLIAILLPSLSRARDMTKSTLCMTHLKEFGNATSMYLMDHKDVLPGPLHPAMFTNVFGPPALSEFGRQQHLPRMLRKYFSDKSAKLSQVKSVVDDLGTCPSFPVPDQTFMEKLPGAPYPFHYAVNTWDYTAENYYFGFIWLQFNNYPEWYNHVSGVSGGVRRFSPKRISQVRKPQSEWAMADAFRRPWASEVDFDINLFRYHGHGSWMKDDTSENTAVNSGQPLPTSPFHLGGGHKREGNQYVYGGRTNTMYFDMHVDSQRGFRGVANPSTAW